MKGYQTSYVVKYRGSAEVARLAAAAPHRNPEGLHRHKSSYEKRYKRKLCAFPSQQA